MSEDPYKERNELDKKFLYDYLQASKDGYQVQVKSNGEWLDIYYDEDLVYVGSAIDIFNSNYLEWCLFTPLGKYFRKNIRINFDDREQILT